MQKTYKPTTIKETLRVEKLYSLHYFAYLKNFTFEGESHDFWELIFCDCDRFRRKIECIVRLCRAGSSIRIFGKILPSHHFSGKQKGDCQSSQYRTPIRARPASELFGSILTDAENLSGRASSYLLYN